MAHPNDPTDADAHDRLDEFFEERDATDADITGAMLSGAKEIERLTTELERAYRCISGFYTARRKGELLDVTAFTYHSPTIGAARRFIKDGALDGADYFVGKPIGVLHSAFED